MIIILSTSSLLLSYSTKIQLLWADLNFVTVHITLWCCKFKTSWEVLGIHFVIVQDLKAALQKCQLFLSVRMKMIMKSYQCAHITETPVYYFKINDEWKAHYTLIMNIIPTCQNVRWQYRLEIKCFVLADNSFTKEKVCSFFWTMDNDFPVTLTNIPPELWA